MTAFFKPYAITAVHIATLTGILWAIQGHPPNYHQVALATAIAALART
jgi:hypothetical protein